MTAVDTSVLVAALLRWHEFHEIALSALLASATARREHLALPAPALIEAYAVMTRLPAQHRLAPKDALELLSNPLEDRARIVALDGSESWSLLREAGQLGIAGGRVYDALILHCARKAGAQRLLTLDRDFARLPLGTIELVVPVGEN